MPLVIGLQALKQPEQRYRVNHSSLAQPQADGLGMGWARLISNMQLNTGSSHLSDLGVRAAIT